MPSTREYSTALKFIKLGTWCIFTRKFCPNIHHAFATWGASENLSCWLPCDLLPSAAKHFVWYLFLVLIWPLDPAESTKVVLYTVVSLICCAVLPHSTKVHLPFQVSCPGASFTSLLWELEPLLSKTRVTGTEAPPLCNIWYKADTKTMCG